MSQRLISAGIFFVSLFIVWRMRTITCLRKSKMNACRKRAIGGNGNSERQLGKRCSWGHGSEFAITFPNNWTAEWTKERRATFIVSPSYRSRGGLYRRSTEQRDPIRSIIIGVHCESSAPLNPFDPVGLHIIYSELKNLFVSTLCLICSMLTQNKLYCAIKLR